LAGLRQIDEFAVYAPRLRRLGHALALDLERCEAFYEVTLTLRPASLTALEDLCWSRSAITPTKEVDEAIVQLGETSGFVLSPSEWESWYTARFDWPRLRSELGYEVWPEGGGSLGEPMPTQPPGQRTHSDPIARALDAYVFVSEEPNAISGYAYSNEPVADPELARRVRALQASLYRSLRELVVRRLLERDIVIESCPTSNCRIGRYVRLRHHPLPRFLAENLTCTVNSDDPAIISTLVHEEVAWLDAVGAFSRQRNLREQVIADGRRFTAIGVPSSGGYELA
jgi:hypothetical protein